MANYYWNRYNADAIYNYRVAWNAFNENNYQESKIPDPNNPNTKYYFDASANGNSIILTNEVYGAHLTTVGGIIFRRYENQPHLAPTALKVLSKGDGTVRVTASAMRIEQELAGYSQGSFVSTIQADYNAYTNNARNVDGYWYVRGAIVNTPPTYVQIPAQTVRKNTTVSIVLANYFTDAENLLTYTASSNNTNIATVSIINGQLIITGKAIGTASITVTANDGSLSTSQTFNAVVANTIPTIAITQPSSNVTLYENDLFQIVGSASDIDANQSITIYAQVNNEQRIVLAVGLSNAPVAFNKQLKFKSSKLYDGDGPITGNLTDGTSHVLKVWAQDGDGAQSTITERAFYVVPNRPPTLTVDAVQPNGIIDNDKFSISGTASDLDGNSVTAAYRINSSNSIALEINEGRWSFDIALSQLIVGQNTIVIELVDSYNFKVSKTIKLNKNEVKTPILNSVARYKIEPPRGSAKGVLLWIQRDVELDLIAELSMTLQGEQEQYVTLTADHTAPVSPGIVEDEFYFEVDEPKNNIILKLSTSRPNTEVNNKIHLISGVLE